MGEEKLRKRRRGEKKPSLDLDLDLDLDFASFDRTAFPQILAASFNLQNLHARSLLSRSLRSLVSLLTQTLTPSLLLPPQSLFSLFPLLLNPKYPSVVSLEVIGAVALCSLESNAMVASDEAVVKGLVWALGSENRQLVKAACNALMDLATSPFGRERLIESSAVEKLLQRPILEVLFLCLAWIKEVEMCCIENTRMIPFQH